MVEFKMDMEHAILTICPKGPLTEMDFGQAAAIADPIIAEQGALNGLIIQADSFPGWESFASAISHFRFVRDHHRHIRRIAVVSDDVLLKIAPRLSSHFVHAEIRQFKVGDYEQAREWITAEAEPGRRPT